MQNTKHTCGAAIVVNIHNRVWMKFITPTPKLLPVVIVCSLFALNFVKYEKAIYKTNISDSIIQGGP